MPVRDHQLQPNVYAGSAVQGPLTSLSASPERPKANVFRQKSLARDTLPSFSLRDEVLREIVLPIMHILLRGCVRNDSAPQWLRRRGWTVRLRGGALR